jgi:ribose transport system permease protein
MSVQWIKRIDWQEVGIPLAFFSLCIIFALSSNKFLTVRNLTNVARQISILAFLSYGMTFVIVSGGIDISVGSAVSLISMVTGGMMVSNGNIPFGILMGILCGTLIGIINGLLVSLVQIPPFIVTMGTGTICGGLALLYANGMPIVGLPHGFGVIGSGYLGPIPIPVIIALFFFLVSAFILRYTAYGRYVLAIGGNEEAVRLSGVNTKLIKLVAYALTGFLTGIGAIVLSSRIISGYPNLGLGMELQAIAAVVIGGGTLGGGYGTMTGTLFGVLMIGVIQNGLNILGVSSFVQMIVIGVIIISSVTYDIFRKKKLAE